MKIFHNFTETSINKPTAMTIGKFDGLHKGHELLVERIIEKKKGGLKSLVITFDRPTDRLPGGSERLLMSKNEKYALFRHKGVDFLLELVFDERMRGMSPEDFIRNLVEICRLKYIICGSDFTFGYKGAGNGEMLKAFSAEFGFEAEIIDKIKLESRVISSTYIREVIAAGEIEKANRLLGYPYFIIGEITHGNGIGHTRIGRATINIIPPDDKLLPPKGVYATEVYLQGRRYYGVTNLGMRPTIKEDVKRLGIETHILNFDRDVYDCEARVVFLKYLREEREFSTLSELKKQIEEDISKVYRFFNSKKTC